MKISRRAERTQASPIRKLIPFANDAEIRGIKVLKLNIGQPDIETPGFAMEAVTHFDEAVLAYSPSDGFKSLREKVAQYLTRYGIRVQAPQVSITTGGSEAVIFAIAAVCDVGDNIIIPEPFYANYKSFATMLGVDVIPLTTRFDNNFHIDDPKALKRKINKKTRALLLCNPGNPTGTVYSEKEIEMFARVAADHDLFIISDEVYREFLYDGVKFTSPLTVKEIEDRVIITDSISKRFSSCGARIGFLVSKNSDVMQAVLKFAMARLSPPTIGQRLAERAFSMEFSYFDGIVKEYEKRRNVLTAELGKGDRIFFARPEGAFYMMVKLGGVDSEAFARFLLEDFQLNGETLLIAPGPGFYETAGLGKDEIRIAYILGADKVERAARILREGLAAYRAEH